MRQKWHLVLACVIIICGVWWNVQRGSGNTAKSTSPRVTPPHAQPTESVADLSDTQVQDSRELIFIPYWNIPSPKSELMYQRFAYFGVSVNGDGTIIDDDGLKQEQGYLAIAPVHTRYLTVRMLDESINEQILSTIQKQDALISTVLAHAKSNQYTGIILDLERSGVSFLTDSSETTQFVERFAQKTHESALQFTMLIYGDVYVRHRPYEVKKIADASDEIQIMLYDFHKPRGEPGPNFPFSQKATYGYDMSTLIADLSKDVAPEKLTIIYGMYGYDWTLGPQGKPLKAAKAISLRDIEKNLLPDCVKTVSASTHSLGNFSLASVFSLSVVAQDIDSIQNCQVFTDSVSREKKITYGDAEGYRHEVWFEDWDSVLVKKTLFQKYKINSFGYWVWGYF